MSFEENPLNLTITDHLAELRSRLIKSLYAILLGMVVCYNFSDRIFDIIRGPIAPYLPTGGLVFTAPTDKFIAHLKLSFFGGMILTCPIWIYQIWCFISPGLYKKDKSYSLGFIFAGSILFLLGVLFAYFGVFPMAFQFLMGFGGETDKPMITIDQYLSFFITTTLMFGLAFEIPLVIVMLGLMEIVSARFLREKRRYAIVGMSVLAAIITPPDLLSMLLMLGPMVVLYEISIVVVAIFERRRARALQEINRL
jgi:sec-independent protein translocase protein TatC